MKITKNVFLGFCLGLCIMFSFGATSQIMPRAGSYQATEHFVIDTRTGKIVTWVVVPKAIKDGTLSNNTSMIKAMADGKIPLEYQR